MKAQVWYLPMSVGARAQVSGGGVAPQAGIGTKRVSAGPGMNEKLKMSSKVGCSTPFAMNAFTCKKMQPQVTVL